MPVTLYMDVHVPQAITDQLRRRGIDVLTAIDDGYKERTDEEVLDRAAELGRVVFTQDIRFHALAERFRREGRAFNGLIFGHQLGGTIGQFVKDLETIALASEPHEWVGATERLPL